MLARLNQKGCALICAPLYSLFHFPRHLDYCSDIKPALDGLLNQLDRMIGEKL